MIYDAKSGEISVINGQGTAPKAATPDLFKGEGRIPGNGPLAATIPAVMDAMALALESKGTMRLEQVMAPAIELADGFPMYGFLRGILISERPATERYEWSAKTYYPNGQIPEVGEMFRQPNLARTLRSAPVLLVCVARPNLLESRPTWGGGNPRALAVELGPLSPVQSGELVDALLARAAPSPVVELNRAWRSRWQMDQSVPLS